ncbi:MAG TPA: hypothetical protein VEW28_04030 [Candidatus Kapabacteria bacterium]|nr:hypothetical protein [Candidatus Kapabacteria bacterium]
MFFTSTAFSQSKDSLTAPIDDYRHFIMPSAKPITNGYIGFWELAFLQGGFGVSDFLSVSGGVTIMPTVSFKSQFAFLQAKATLAQEEGVSFAVGANLLRMTSEHFYLHPFLEATIEMQNEMRYTGLVFFKAVGDDYPIVNVYPYGAFSFSYGSPLGAGLGFDTPIKGIPNSRLVVEAWNHDLSTPSKLALVFAVRVESQRFSSDFGFMYFTLPLLTPVANFVWRL